MQTHSMETYSRRNFMKLAGIASAAALGLSFNFKKKMPLLSFSTLGCPDWSFQQIVAFAAANKYDGLELRGLQRELDLPKCTEFNSQQNIKTTVALMRSHGLKFVNLGASSNLHQPPGSSRTKNLDDAKRFIDLAHQINCPFIRVFPNNFPTEQEKTETIDLIVSGLLELGQYASQSGVKVLLETHGDVVYSEDLEKIMKASEHPQVGLIWDPLNMWVITREAPATVYTPLKKYIHHVHIKNATLANGKINYVLLNNGEVPVFEAIDLLYQDNYSGYYSFEWEKLWHPEIESPEIALADYPKAMARHLETIRK